jgi:hypothetical protein
MAKVRKTMGNATVELEMGKEGKKNLVCHFSEF